MHSPRSRIRGRDPHPPSGGGRHRRRSPPAPPSPRYQRRPQRRTPPPRRGDDPHPDVSAPAHHRILLEAGRLAAHYLVAQGVIPEHVLRAREDPPAPRPAHPPASRGRKLNDGGGGGDPRSRRNDGDWARVWEDDDRQARKATRWDRRSHSFDERRKYHDAGHDVDRGARRTRDYDEPRRPPMSRSYSHNDRRPSADGGRVDPRSRSRTRSYYAGSGSGSSRDLGHTKVPDSGIIPAAAGRDYRHVDEMPRHQRRVPSSVVVAEVNDSADEEMAIEDGEMVSEIHGLNRTRDISEGEDGEFEQDISEGEDGEFAAARLNGVEMDATHTQHQLSDSDTNVHPLESVEEPAVHRGSQLSNAVEDREAANAPMVMDACTRETLGEDNDCSQARDEMVAPHPQSEGVAGAGDFNRDKPELPASCRVFDLNVVETPDACEMTEISGDPQADHVSDSVPDLVGRIHQQTNCHASEIQGQDERAGDSHMSKNGHDLIRYDLNSEAVEDAQDIHLLENEKLLLSHGIDAHDMTRIQWSNGHLHLNQNADGLEHENDWMENHTVIGEQLLLGDGMDGHPVRKYQMASEPKRLPMGVYDLHSYNLKSEKMLLNDGADKHAHDSCHLKDGQMLLNQSANRQARIHNRANERTIPVINLEDDDYEEQSDIREFLESKSCQCLGVGPAIL
ncbi:uncharacterized protein [Miscanthus floridulus]|uniref:uncharacterized protein isoform X1 n=1 Tax=Miscanthus floridulus TaxID=154761 RepID=UPI003459E720